MCRQNSVFDIVLVLEYFRSVVSYLSVIKYLSSEYRIGVVQVPVEETLLKKNRQAQEDFTSLCVEFGAEVVRVADNLSVKLLVVPQRAYSDEALRIIDSIDAANKVALLSLAWAGIDVHDRFMKRIGFDAVFAMDKGFIEYLLHARNCKSYDGETVVEVGVPFLKYPVFDSPKIDYMIAMPTAFSFAHDSDKWMFMECVLKLLDTLPLTEKIVLKTHNGMDRDQFSGEKIRQLAAMVGMVPGLFQLIRKLLMYLKRGCVSRVLSRLYTAYLYEKVLSRATPLFKLTEYSQLSIEVFLPNIDKGMIGGLSNTIWGCQFAQMPYYNCVDIDAQERDAADRLLGNKKASKAIDQNMGYFGVPFCEGELQFDERSFDKISNQTREADLLYEIRKFLDC